MTIVSCIINCNYLPGVICELSENRRQDIGHGKVSATSLHIICGKVVGITVVDSVEDRAQNISVIVVDKEDFKVVIVLGGDQNCLSFKVRVVFVGDSGDSLETSITGHMQITLFQHSFDINE